MASPVEGRNFGIGWGLPIRAAEERVFGFKHQFKNVLLGVEGLQGEFWSPSLTSSCHFLVRVGSSWVLRRPCPEEAESSQRIPSKPVRPATADRLHR